MSTATGGSPPKLARALATWFGCGLSPVAPGTIGTLGALPLYFLTQCGGSIAVWAMAIVVTVVGVWSADVFAKATGSKDPQQVVIDEVAGVFFALAAAPFTVRGIVASVVFFRAFDILKPFPARRAERLPGGWGIVADDVVAGLQAAAAVRVLDALGVLS